ncbi:nicotinamide-nucleotide amidase [Streptomyces sp. WMMB 714]|uniref:CinA family protein n=1 Tax=Streptomyces sp. WMMB 714 TaxID=1286822 RepID=UPI000823E893|nr:CinA family protein [Streptomyces sp. WMMB 714]SCK48758.1 nicotinamide-nucleotide amidase [Streptomyces sp. WMMB 714]
MTQEREEDYFDVSVEVLDLLIERDETVAVAESLTGGMVAAEITSAPGSSQAFLGSVTAYATDVKQELLGVDGDLLQQRGAVDAEVARQMAQGVRKLLRSTWGVATTGVAGPEPQDGNEVGTVYVAVAGPRGADSRLLQLDGNRATIRKGSVTNALKLLNEELTGKMRPKDTEQHGGN